MCSSDLGEILLGQAMAAGLRCVKVIRYPGIWGHSQSGFISSDNNYNHGWKLLTTCVHLRKFPYMDNENGIAIVPVDVAAALTLELLLSGSTEDGVYNMTTETAVTQRVMERVMAERGVEVEFLPLAQWRDQVFGETEGLAKDGTLQALRWLYDDDETGQPRGRHNHPLFAPQGETDGPKAVGNRISDKMRRNLAEASVELLTLEATIVIDKHLDCWTIETTGQPNELIN